MEMVRGLDRQFKRLHERNVALVQAVPIDKLYRQPPRERERIYPAYSCGEHLLRSAASVEQTCGGLISNLWDDPFEWTLPEALSTSDKIVDYLNETEATRLRVFGLFRSDSDLRREVAVPSGGMLSLFDLLLETFARASHHQGRACATLRLFSDARLPRL